MTSYIYTLQAGKQAVKQAGKQAGKQASRQASGKQAGKQGPAGQLINGRSEHIPPPGLPALAPSDILDKDRGTGLLSEQNAHGLTPFMLFGLNTFSFFGFTSNWHFDCKYFSDKSWFGDLTYLNLRYFFLFSLFSLLVCQKYIEMRLKAACWLLFPLVDTELTQISWFR